MPARRAFLVFIAAALGINGASAASTLRSDEHVVLYPATARARPGGWDIEVHGIVYEPERARLLASLMRRALGVDEDALTTTERATLRERCRYFLVDNERGKHLTLELAGRSYAMGTSAANGHFQATVRLESTDIPEARDGLPDTNRTFQCKIGAPGPLARSADLEIQFLHETGLSVISDIDDTIKISEIGDRHALIQNTFCRPYKPVPGLAARYQDWSATGAQFHYLTASPWQLYLPLSEFVRSNGFPSGTFHMKQFRLKDGGFIELFKSPERYKPAVIEGLLKQYPKRRFVLVGDSGEKDPEIYGAVARRHPQQILEILIRDVTDETAESPRYAKAFARLPRERWQLFKVPSQIRPQKR